MNQVDGERRMRRQPLKLRGSNKQKQNEVRAARREAEEEENKANRNKRGFCLIISNECYEDESRFCPRPGSRCDRVRLRNTFEELNFVVREKENLSASEIYWVLHDYAFDVDHSNCDMFICFILAHGGKDGTIYGVDGRTQNLSDIIAMFDTVHCPSLADKQKLFLIQACRGRKKQTLRLPEVRLESQISSLFHQPEDCNHFNQGDFLIGYATVHGYVAVTDTAYGSPYIQSLCELIEGEADKTDLHKILRRVNKIVSDKTFTLEDGTVLQIVAEVESTLRNKVYLK